MARTLGYNPGMAWNVLGHEWAAELLREHLVQGKPRHAYLFTGAEGVGRRTLALRLAQALNCPNPPAPGEACLACQTCRQIERMEHPDLAVVQAEQKGGVLKVEQVRELQHTLALAPYQSRYRLALLLRFEEAHQSAANALLKTLEEPPPRVIMLLTAASVESLLPTIVSRCEVLSLRPLPVQTIAAGLQARWGLPTEQAQLLAHISGGRPGFALRLALDPQELEKRRARLEEHLELLALGRIERFKYAEGLARDKANLQDTLQSWLSLWRDLLTRACGASTPLANIDLEAEVGRLASALGLEAVRETIQALTRAQELVERNVNTRLVVESLMLKLPSVEAANYGQAPAQTPPNFS